jgi:hypothetical protein
MCLDYFIPSRASALVDKGTGMEATGKKATVPRQVGFMVFTLPE